MHVSKECFELCKTIMKWSSCRNWRCSRTSEVASSCTTCKVQLLNVGLWPDYLVHSRELYLITCIHFPSGFLSSHRYFAVILFCASLRSFCPMQLAYLPLRNIIFKVENFKHFKCYRSFGGYYSFGLGNYRCNWYVEKFSV